MVKTSALLCQEICDKQYWVTKHHEVWHHTGIEKVHCQCQYMEDSHVLQLRMISQKEERKLHGVTEYAVLDKFIMKSRVWNKFRWVPVMLKTQVSKNRS